MAHLIEHADIFELDTELRRMQMHKRILWPQAGWAWLFSPRSLPPIPENLKRDIGLQPDAERSLSSISRRTRA